MHFHLRLFILALILAGSVFVGPRLGAQAQSGDGAWSNFENASNTPTTSSWPAIVADTAGNVHLFWAEDADGKTDNPDLSYDIGLGPGIDETGRRVNLLKEWGESLYYTRWDGEKWYPPVNIHVSPVLPNGVVLYPETTVDPQGMLHVIWLGAWHVTGTVFYMRAPADQALSPSAWSQPKQVAGPVAVSAGFGQDIVSDLNGGLHILYSQIGIEGDYGGAYVINSFDGGDTWSSPVLLYATPPDQGVNSVQIIVDKAGRLHATWSHWNLTGNGQEVYYAQSRDEGRTWSKPHPIAVRQPDWYEVDWLSVGVVGDEVHALWEGGIGAYLNERISHDGGLTWDKPYRILNNLVGENGWAEMLTDSADNLSMTVVKRGSANPVIHGLWATQWTNSDWEPPLLLGTTRSDFYDIADQTIMRLDALVMVRGTFTGNGLRYQRSTILNGNEIFVALNQNFDGEIHVTHRKLLAPFIAPQPYPTPQATPTPTPLPRLPTPTWPPPSVSLPNSPTGGTEGNPANYILIALLPVLVLIGGVLVSRANIRRR